MTYSALILLNPFLYIMRFGTALSAKMTHLCLILIAGLACMSPAQADIYVAAQGAPLSATPDGTADAPFATLGAAVDARANRDIAIVLMDGRHPAIDIRGTANPPLEIRAQTPSGAHVPSLSIRAKGTRVSGIGVWPQSPSTAITIW